MIPEHCALHFCCMGQSARYANKDIDEFPWVCMWVAENPTILLIFYQALFRFAAAMECINLADQMA